MRRHVRSIELLAVGLPLITTLAVGVVAYHVVPDFTLAAALVLGALTLPQWRWTHKTVFSLLGWAVIAALLAGRKLRGWRGRRATRWLYAGALLLLLAYAGSRFVMQFVLGRPVD